MSDNSKSDVSDECMALFEKKMVYTTADLAQARLEGVREGFLAARREWQRSNGDWKQSYATVEDYLSKIEGGNNGTDANQP